MLTLEQLRQITHGALRIWEEDGAFCFSRFTPAQAAQLRLRGRTPREDASASMRLEFFTHGGPLAFDYTVTPGSGRSYYGIEIALNGISSHLIYRETNVDAGHLTYTIPCSAEPTRVTVYFPHSVRLRIRNLSLPGDLTASRRSMNYLALGDSITQGHDAARPSQSYVNQLTDALDAQVLNQAIGGEVFCPENLDSDLPFSPDLITVAFGTNDWDYGQLVTDIPKAYLDKLTGLYPHTPILLLLPIWRQEEPELRAGITLAQGRDFLARCAGNYPNIHVIDCSRFVPAEPAYFFDVATHPNDAGFACYGENLIQTVKGLPILSEILR